jgi:hypothetical protein
MMETLSLKSLSFKVLHGNIPGNIPEKKCFQRGEKIGEMFPRNSHVSAHVSTEKNPPVFSNAPEHMAPIHQERVEAPDQAEGRPCPYLDPEGDPVIPFESDPKYHWWAGGQSLDVTMRELWEERAAIREFEGGQTREQAERGAMEDVQRIMQ